MTKSSFPVARKRFGQHFLHDNSVIARIIAVLSPKPDEHLIEIGPGQGALTFPLLEKVKQLEVVEIDRDLIAELKKYNQEKGELIIHPGDVLKFNFAALKKDTRLLRIIGNLPYNISTPLLFHLLSFPNIISDMHFMLQKEVAERLAAKANDDDYGRLSVMVQYHTDVELLFHVSPRAFTPPPQVQSSIVRLVPHRTHPFPVQDYALFENIVRSAFGQRRKTLRNSLKEWVQDDDWAHIGIHSDARPENLSVKEFVTIANILSNKGN